MAKKYIVSLSDDARTQLLALTKRGKASARRLNRAHMLLQADAGLSDDAIARALHSGTATVERIRKRFVEEGLAGALGERPRPGGGSASWMGNKRSSCLLWLVVRRQRGARAGPCRCSPIGW